MGNFDLKFIGNLASKNNYIGIANYISSFKFENKTIQAQMNQLAAGLKRNGRMMEAIMNAAPKEDRYKLAFYFKSKAGIYGSTNDQSDYDRRYLANINNIGNKKDKQADYIEYTFNNQEAFNKFSDSFGKVGLADTENRQSGLLNKDGTHILRVYKSDLGKNNIFNRLNEALSNTNTTELRSTAFGTEPGTGAGWTMSQPYEAPGFSAVSYDKDGNQLVKSIGFMKEQADAIRQAKEAEGLYKDIVSRLNNNTIPADLMTKGYMCKGQAEIVDRVAKGLMEEKEANFLLGQINDYYSNLIFGESLTKYDVYATDQNPDTHNFKEITDTREKAKLTEELRSAIDEGRCRWQAASAGGRVGTKITINAAQDKDGNFIGNNKSGFSLFVPDLLEEDARDMMESDPEAAVTIKRAEHMAFGHQYDLNDGGRLVEFQQDGGAYYENGSGRVYRRPEEVHKIMLENEMLDLTKQELANDRLQRDMSDDDYNALVEEYATRLYAFNNNITSDEDLANLDKEGVKQGISRYISLLLSN